MFLPALLSLVTALPTIDLPAGPGPLNNPLKGYAAYSSDNEKHYLPVSMAFVYTSWRELEPQEGVYKFAEWEAKQWDTPLSKDKHIVFRVWLDYPSRDPGVPQWLIDKGVKMRGYDQYGGGKSPDYDDPKLISALTKLIQKLGERYDKNPRVGFIQVGILGHWGEFHTYPKDELFASLETQKKVVNALRKAFPNKKLMGRYPDYESLRLPGMGYHDDMIPEDTLPPEDWKFLPRMETGKVESNWKAAATGGEMVPHQSAKWLGEGWGQLLTAVKDAHFTWIGPYCPAMVAPPDETFKQRGEELIRKLGYEYRLTKLTAPAEIRAGDRVSFRLEGVNQGVAPFYYPWKVKAVLLDSADKVVATAVLGADIRKWQPGSFALDGSLTAAKAGTYRLGIGIEDPWKGKPAIGFANRLPVVGGYAVLGAVTVR